MLFGETVAVYCENHMKHTDTLCGQNTEFLYVKAGGTYSDQWVLKGSFPKTENYGLLVYDAV
jgi:hypothetical protein